MTQARLRSRAARATAAAALLAQAGCLDLGLLADTAFPATVPGLPADGAWLSLPVRRWLTEPGLGAEAISACLACPAPAAVGLFRAHGRQAADLGRTLDDPARLERALRALARSRPAAKPSPNPSTISVERRREAGLPGFLVRIERADGSRSAAGFVLAHRRPGSVTVLLVIAPDEATALRLARGAAAHLS